MSMQVNLGQDTLGELERELLPVAVGNPQKSIYRRLLVELYGRDDLPPGAEGAGRRCRDAGAAAARAELAKIGARAVKPLLDALADDKESQQKVAIEVLAYVENKGAGPALYNYATGTADKCAAGAGHDRLRRPPRPRAPPPVRADAGAPRGRRVGACPATPSRWRRPGAWPAWATARPRGCWSSCSPRRRPTCARSAAVGLGLTHDSQARPGAGGAGARDRGQPDRAGGGDARARRAGRAAPIRPMLLANAGSTILLREAALLAMARLGAATTTRRETGPGRGHRGGRVLARRSAAPRRPRSRRRAGDPRLPPRARGAARARRAAHVARRARGPRPRPYGAAKRAAALVALAPALRKAAVAAVSTSPDRARVVADALLGAGGKLGARALHRGGRGLEPRLAAEVDEVVESIAHGGGAGLRGAGAAPRRRRAHARRGAPGAAARAGGAGRGGRRARRSRRGRAPRRAVGHRPGAEPPAHRRRGPLVKESPSWPLRVRAAEALGRLGAGAGAPAPHRATAGPAASSSAIVTADTAPYVTRPTRWTLFLDVDPGSSGDSPASTSKVTLRITRRTGG